MGPYPQSRLPPPLTRPQTPTDPLAASREIVDPDAAVGPRDHGTLPHTHTTERRSPPGPHSTHPSGDSRRSPRASRPWAASRKADARPHSLAPSPPQIRSRPRARSSTRTLLSGLATMGRFPNSHTAQRRPPPGPHRTDRSGAPKRSPRASRPWAASRKADARPHSLAPSPPQIRSRPRATPSTQRSRGPRGPRFPTNAAGAADTRCGHQCAGPRPARAPGSPNRTRTPDDGGRRPLSHPKATRLRPGGSRPSPRQGRIQASC